jgi:outer membrane protein OmpA-like peptidoglycan-associated protein
MRSQLISLLTLALTSAFSQTLIKNPGFEEADSSGANGWINTALTPDIKNNNKDKFYTEDKGCKEEVKNNFLGLMMNGEVISTKLKAPLEKDAIYIIKLKVQKPNNFCPKGLGKVTVALTANTLSMNPGSANYFYPIPFVNLYTENLRPLKDNCKWEEFSAIYTASGTENYFHIGDFRKSKEPNAPPYNSMLMIDSLEDNNCGYKHIDNISIEKISISKTKAISIEGLRFENNKSVLLPEATKSLDKLVGFVAKLHKYKLVISGHADDVGEKERNLELSKERATAVMNYLIKKGIPKARLSAVGYGDTKPLAANDTDKNRSKNRRVEIQLAN